MPHDRLVLDIETWGWFSDAPRDDLPPGAWHPEDMLVAPVEDDDGRPEARWVTMGAVADTSDAVAALVWRKELGWLGVLSTWGLAIPAAAAGWRASAGLRRRPA